MDGQTDAKVDGYLKLSFAISKKAVFGITSCQAAENTALPPPEVRTFRGEFLLSSLMS